MPTHLAAQTLASGDVAAIVAWQPNSGAALELVKGSRELYTSADEPGIIYDTLAVSAESLLKHRAEWSKVVAAWYDVIDYLNDPANRDEDPVSDRRRGDENLPQGGRFRFGLRFQRDYRQVLRRQQNL